MQIKVNKARSQYIQVRLVGFAAYKINMKVSVLAPLLAFISNK